MECICPGIVKDSENTERTSCNEPDLPVDIAHPLSREPLSPLLTIFASFASGYWEREFLFKEKPEGNIRYDQCEGSSKFSHCAIKPCALNKELREGDRKYTGLREGKWDNSTSKLKHFSECKEMLPNNTISKISSGQLLSPVQLCDSMNHSMPSLPVHHQLPEFTQTHIHWVSDAIQPSHPLSSPSPPAFNLY